MKAVTESVSIGGVTVASGQSAHVKLPAARLPTYTMLDLPVTVVNGMEEGPGLWLSAAIHGDELNGVEIVRRVLERVDAAAMRGLLLAVPIVNVFGFIGQSRYLPDRRDLNRSFPGSARGSLAAQIARLFMTEIVDRCSHGIDLHTAAPPRINLPQVRADLDDAETRRCAVAFAAPFLLNNRPRQGTLRAAALKRGITSLTYEAGEPLRFNEDAITAGVDGVLRVMAELEMIEPCVEPAGAPCQEAVRTKWLRAPQSGVIHLETGLGQSAVRNQVLARVTDPFGGAGVAVKAPFAGTVIGHVNNPLVHRGDGVIHLGAGA